MIAAILVPRFGAYFAIFAASALAVMLVVRFATKNPVAASVVAALATVFCGVQYLNFTGYCYDQGRFLSDDDLTKAAVSRILSKGSVGADVISYASVDDFLEKNEDCCFVHRENRHPSDSDRIDDHWLRFFGRYYVTVEAVYKYRDGALKENFGSYVDVSACGKAVYLTGFSTLQKYPSGEINPRTGRGTFKPKSANK